MESLESGALIDVSTKMNEETGKPYYPNLDAQKAAVKTVLNQSEKYLVRLHSYFDLLTTIEKCKAELHRLEQERHDTKSEADYRVGLLNI